MKQSASFAECQIHTINADMQTNVHIVDSYAVYKFTVFQE